jgi:hypothetical protein
MLPFTPLEIAAIVISVVVVGINAYYVSTSR